jgi:hypothetical protein
MAEQDTEQPKIEDVSDQAHINVTVLPDGNLNLDIAGLAPWGIIGIAETVKAQAFAMMAGAQVGGLQRPPAGLAEQLRKGGRN